MKLPIVLLILCIVLPIHAEVLTYKFSITVTTNGENATAVRKKQGYLVLDNDHSTVVTVTVRSDLKRFFVSNEGMTVEKVYGLNQSFTTIHRVNGAGLDFGKGRNTRVLINGKTLSVPRVITTISRNLLMEAGPSLYEAGGSAVLQTKQTAQYDAAGYNVDRVLSALRGLLDSQGYLEDDSIR